MTKSRICTSIMLILLSMATRVSIGQTIGDWKIGNVGGEYFASVETGSEKLLLRCIKNRIHTEIKPSKIVYDGYVKYRTDGTGKWNSYYISKISKKSEDRVFEFAKGNHPIIDELINGNSYISIQYQNNLSENNVSTFSLNGSTKAITGLRERCNDSSGFVRHSDLAQGLVGNTITVYQTQTLYARNAWDNGKILYRDKVKVLGVAKDLELASNNLDVPNIMLKVQTNNGEVGFIRYGSHEKIDDHFENTKNNEAESKLNEVSDKEIIEFCTDAFNDNIQLVSDCAMRLWSKRRNGQLVK